MIVRVFVPKKLDPSDGSDMSGTDHDFAVMPREGQKIRLSDPGAPDFEVERTGFIQDGNSFVACVWLKNEVPT